jgi:hypothetical protein
VDGNNRLKNKLGLFYFVPRPEPPLRAKTASNGTSQSLFAGRLATHGPALAVPDYLRLQAIHGS